MSCCMCWWRKNNVEDDNDAREALLAEENTVAEKMTKGKKASVSKEKQYEDILNKYRKSSATPQQPPNENCPPVSTEPLPAVPESPTPSNTVSRTSSDSQYVKSKKNSTKSKSNLKGSQSAPPVPLSQNTNFEGAESIQKVQQGLSERKDLLEDVVEKTEELQQNTRHFRSVSKRLKDKQAQKLKKSKLPW